MTNVAECCYLEILEVLQSTGSSLQFDQPWLQSALLGEGHRVQQSFDRSERSVQIAPSVPFPWDETS